MKRQKLLIIVALLGNITAYATDIFGTVKDNKNGEEIVGATIKIKEQPMVGTTSALDGSFKISVDRIPTTLVISYVGYETKEVDVNKSDNINVLLKSADFNLC